MSKTQEQTVGQVYLNGLRDKVNVLALEGVLTHEEAKSIHSVFMEKIRKDGKEAESFLFPVRGI